MPTPTPLLPGIFGTVVPPPGPSFANPVEGFSRIFIFSIQAFIFALLIFFLIQILMGVMSWINSGGDSEKLAIARKRLTNAIIGILVAVVVLGIFTVITSDMLGLIRRNSDGQWIFKLPRIGDP